MVSKKGKFVEEEHNCFDKILNVESEHSKTRPILPAFIGGFPLHGMDGKQFTVQVCPEGILTCKNCTLTVLLSVFKVEIFFPRNLYCLTSRPIMFEELHHNFSNKLCFELSHSYSEILEIVLPIIGGSRQSVTAPLVNANNKHFSPLCYDF